MLNMSSEGRVGLAVFADISESCREVMVVQVKSAQRAPTVPTWRVRIVSGSLRLTHTVVKHPYGQCYYELAVTLRRSRPTRLVTEAK